ncbi:hypothetical protein NQ317_019104 [Molorchus minor]|uniref:RING-type E3 ubiquitin transferase n=1 Tax=Molorchus minor TaxID=1323400 RepID=A0ABQ9JM15_9CUCU|nr:hypothetical protein NQ317_019104 [Molorchus minor]
MGKRQHQKDKMYLTYTEWTTLYGGKKSGHLSKEEENFKRLPFDHCCVSLQPFEIPYCDLDGNIFDLEPLIPFLKKFKINPVTGKSLDFKSLIQLNFRKNAEGEFECPVMFKPFTKSSHIAAIATTGNVYLMEAIEQLNIKNRNWKDLITDEPFERRDIIVLQDPNHLSKFDISKFHHVKNNLRVETEEEIAERGDPQARLKSVNPETKYTLEELNREYKPPTIEINAVESTEKADKFNAAHYSTGAVAASFTSTAMNRKLVHEAAIVHEDEVRYERVRKKGYVRLVTNLGNLNLELHCDMVPKTCENFIKHSENGYYNGTKFHRSIRNFMIQGGDPTNTGNGGESIWGKNLRMNLGQTCPIQGEESFLWLILEKIPTDLSYNKHTIFGRVVGGIETLTEMERIEVDNKDRPIEDIVIFKAQTFVNPYDEADEILAKEREEEINKQKKEELAKNKKLNVQKELKVFHTGVGKYINPSSMKGSKEEIENNTEPDAKKRKTYNSFNFNN